jgi:hypothetical protein
VISGRIETLEKFEVEKSLSIRRELGRCVMPRMQGPYRYLTSD